MTIPVYHYLRNRKFRKTCKQINDAIMADLLMQGNIHRGIIYGVLRPEALKTIKSACHKLSNKACTAMGPKAIVLQVLFGLGIQRFQSSLVGYCHIPTEESLSYYHITHHILNKLQGNGLVSKDEADDMRDTVLSPVLLGWGF